MLIFKVRDVYLPQVMWIFDSKQVISPLSCLEYIFFICKIIRLRQALLKHDFLDLEFHDPNEAVVHMIISILLLITSSAKLVF